MPKWIVWIIGLAIVAGAAGYFWGNIGQLFNESNTPESTVPAENPGLSTPRTDAACVGACKESCDQFSGDTRDECIAECDIFCAEEQ